MVKNILFFLILIFEINSDYVIEEDNYTSCEAADSNKCSSIKFETKNIECCNIGPVVPIELKDELEGELGYCNPTFSTFISEDIKSQLESISIEDLGIKKAYYKYVYPQMKLKIKCSEKSVTYETGNYKYTNDDLKKLKSKNHCLYYYYCSILDLLITDEYITITKDKCINAESLDITKNSDINCAYTEVTILFSDGTKDVFETCHFLPSESIKSKKLNPTTEEAFKNFADFEASNNGKVVAEYNVTMVDKKGRTITYNSVTGTVESNSDSIDYSMMYSMNKFLVLIMLIILF